MSNFPRKILVSSSGWSSWCCGPKEAVQYVVEYQPIIEFLENGGEKESKEFMELIEELETIMDEKFGINFYTGGSRDLVVKEVNGPYTIEEYDGESVLEQENADFWFY